jgi:hypothetical protein
MGKFHTIAWTSPFPPVPSALGNLAQFLDPPTGPRRMPKPSAMSRRQSDSLVFCLIMRDRYSGPPHFERKMMKKWMS